MSSSSSSSLLFEFRQQPFIKIWPASARGVPEVTKRLPAKKKLLVLSPGPPNELLSALDDQRKKDERRNADVNGELRSKVKRVAAWFSRSDFQKSGGRKLLESNLGERGFRCCRRRRRRPDRLIEAALKWSELGAVVSQPQRGLRGGKRESDSVELIDRRSLSSLRGFKMNLAALD